ILKKTKLLVSLAVIGVLTFSGGATAFASENSANESSSSITLQTIEEENKVQYDENPFIQERGWGDFLGGLLGGLAPSRTAEQLNGSDYANFKPHNCGPYGQGGTPNSCNY
ncbi:hypothetical protein ACFJWX_09640, partial [Enterococcus faecalis]